MNTIKKDKKSFSRRKFLQRGAIILGGTVITVVAAKSPIRRFLAQTMETTEFPALIANNELSFWFEVLTDNTILLKSPKIEMGQGIFTGFAMIAAEELEVPIVQIKIQHANTATGPIDKVSTGGSTSTGSLFTPIREMAATLREILKTAAAKQWNVAAESIKTENGILTSGNHKATYYEISSLTKDWKAPDKIPALKPQSAFKIIGKEVKRIDLKPKVLGRPIFAIDQTMPQMLYATVLQSPYINGSIKSIDIKEAEKSEGVIRVINEDGFVAIVAKTRYAAEKGLGKLVTEWDIPRKWQQADFEALTTVGVGTGVNVQSVGSAESIIKDSPNQVFKAEYRTPIAAHAHIEPNGTIAHSENGKGKGIIGTQAPKSINGLMAEAFGIEVENMRLDVAYSGGGFGRRMVTDNPTNAARIAKIMGKPIHLFNTREQEFLNGFYRPQTHHILEAKIGKDNEIEAITHNQATPDQVLAPMGNMGYLLLGADFPTAGHGASILYNIEHKSATLWQNKLPIPTGIWRGVGMFPNTFAVESFMNELAHKTGKDPLAMRIKLLSGKEEINQRYQKVLETLAEKSGWNKPKAVGIGRGVAICNDRQTISAAVIEVMVIDKKIQVKKVTQVIDAGLVVNPDGIRQQVEGATMMGITAALYEGLQIKDGQITTSNFNQYPMATLADSPEIEVVMINDSQEPRGVGEPPLSPVAPAIAAAVFDITGQRLRSLPLKLA